MKPYLTPERFRLMRTGAVLTGIPDIEIREVLADAQAIVNAYCNVPLLPTPGSLRGGTATQEEHRWAYPVAPWDRGTRRIYPFHAPIKEVTEFRLLVAAGAYSAIPVDNLVINATEKWVEVTSIAVANSSGLFGVTGWIVPIGGLDDPVAQISYTYGKVLVETDDRAYPIADGELRVFQTSHGLWAGAPSAVKVDGVTKTVTTDYTYDGEIGRVTFAADTSGVVTVDYTHDLDRDVPLATAQIGAHLLGVDKMAKKGFSGGAQRIKVGEISIDRGTPPSQAAEFLPRAVPSAALLLDGHRHWRVA